MADEDKKPGQDPNSGSNGAPAGEGTVSVLEGRIADLTDRLLRAHAEMDNLRKRTEREKDETAKYAISKFARDVLAVGDNLQRAIAAVPAGAADSDPALKALMDGVTMTERDFTNILERHGVERMDAEGEAFNPHQHQAMVEVDNPDVAPGTIVQVYQEGYSLGDRVLRPAMVVIAKGGAKPGSNARDDTEPDAQNEAS
ncbi:MAG: nucleotide exchange factor GrpE [Hyphomicrobium sp.]|jgi:molecular chaperone GrpE